jgi:hypothetical protein
MEALGNQTGVLVDFESYHPEVFETVVVSSEGLLPLVAEKETRRPLAVQLDSVIEGESGREILKLSLFESADSSPCSHHEILQNKALACREDLDRLPIKEGEVAWILKTGEKVFRNPENQLVVWADERELYRTSSIEEFWVADRSQILATRSGLENDLIWIQRSPDGKFRELPLGSAMDFSFLGEDGGFYSFNLSETQSVEGIFLKAKSIYRLERFGSFVAWREIATWPEHWVLQNASVVRTEAQVSGAILEIFNTQSQAADRLLMGTSGWTRLLEAPDLSESAMGPPESLSAEADLEVKKSPEALLKKDRNPQGQIQGQICVNASQGPALQEDSYTCEALRFDSELEILDMTLSSRNELFVGFYDPTLQRSRIDRYDVQILQINPSEEASVSNSESQAIVRLSLLSRIQPQAKLLRFREPPKALQAMAKEQFVKTDSRERPLPPAEDKKDLSSE